MSASRTLRRKLVALLPERTAAKALRWRLLARATMPEAEWPRDLRSAASAVALYQRLERLERLGASGRPPGRISLASLRADLERSPSVLEETHLGWHLADRPIDQPASLRMAPGGRVAYRVRAQPGTRLECRLHAEGSTTGELRSLEFSVTARDAGGDRIGRWRRSLGGPGEGTIAAVSLRLPDIADGRLSLELALDATAEEGRPTGIWIDPCLVEPVSSDTAEAEPLPADQPPRAHTFGPCAAPGTPPGGPPRFSVLMPVHDPNPVFLDRAVASVLHQNDPGWELCLYDDASTDPAVRELLEAHAAGDERIRVERGEQALGIAGATNAALAMATGEFVLLLDHDDEIEPDAIAAISAALAEHPDAEMVYTDEATIDDANRWLGNFLKPAWSPQFFESNMYSCHLGAYRRDRVLEVGGFRPEYDGSQDYDLVLRLSERGSRFVHAPGVRYFWRFHPQSASAGAKPYAFQAAERALTQHLERVGRPGTVEAMNLPGSYRRRVASVDVRTAIVLAITAGADGAETIAACAGALEAAGAELLVAAAGPEAAAPCRAALGNAATIVEGPAGATRAQLCDLATAATDAEALVFLAEPVVPAAPEWLDEMLTVAAIDGVGVVGTLGLSPGGRIEHSGVAIADGVPLINDLEETLAFDDPERVSATQTCVRDVSAASGTVLVLRPVLERLGGLASTGFDQLCEIDLCLRARRAGLRVAVTPNARLRRLGAESAALETALGELFRFQHRWWSDKPDPYYHPAFCPQRATYKTILRPEPRRRWRPAVVGDGQPAIELQPPGLREELADAFLHGSGLEIGPLHSPLRVPERVTVRYVDRMPVTLLRRHYPELAELPLIEIDIMDDGERLSAIEAESQDFVIANHLLEHTGDPISTIGNWLRVLRPGGVIYLAVPDKRYTFDIDREPTSPEHIVRDHEEGPETSRRQHFEEWARHVERVPEERVTERADALETLDYSVHTHVFTERELIQALLLCDERVGPIEIEAMRRNGLETLAVIRKPDPELVRPQPAPAYDVLPVPG